MDRRVELKGTICPETFVIGGRILEEGEGLLGQIPGEVTVYVPDVEVYDGPTEATPKRARQTLHTAGKLLRENITIEEIPYSETVNSAGGITVNIGG